VKDQVAQQSRGLRDLLLIDAAEANAEYAAVEQRSKTIRGLLEQLGGVLHQPQALVLFKELDARGVYSPLRDMIAAVKAGDKDRATALLLQSPPGASGVRGGAGQAD
jgi:methyl-accepting chemotaxis protein